MGISKELTALRAVCSWIEIYKLEDENFPEILEKHIAEQEKQQAEKKHEYDSSNVKNGPHTRSKATLLQQHQQQQTSCSPKTLVLERILNKLIKFDHSTLSRYVLLLQPC